MHWFARIIFTVAGNAFALWIANRYVPGFVLHADAIQLILIGIVLALLNFFLKPALTLVFGPIIVITLGIGLIVVNAFILYLLPIAANYLDFLRGSVTIQTIPALVITTLIVSVINFIIHLAL